MGKRSLTRAVFLDRDGVINQAIVRQGQPYAPDTLEQLVIIEGVGSALTRLRQQGFLLIVVTNQPDVSRGKQSRANVEAINASLITQLPLDAVYVCYHDDHDQCSCRKPKPGMLLEAAQKYQVDLQQSFMVGDRWRDIDAGRAAGCKTIFVDYHYAETAGKSITADFVTRSLADCVDWILGPR